MRFLIYGRCPIWNIYSHVPRKSQTINAYFGDPKFPCIVSVGSLKLTFHFFLDFLKFAEWAEGICFSLNYNAAYKWPHYWQDIHCWRLNVWLSSPSLKIILYKILICFCLFLNPKDTWVDRHSFLVLYNRENENFFLLAEHLTVYLVQLLYRWKKRVLKTAGQK